MSACTFETYDSLVTSRRNCQFSLAEKKQILLVVDKKFKKENINYCFSTNYINKIQGKLIYLVLYSIIIYHDYNGR